MTEPGNDAGKPTLTCHHCGDQIDEPAVSLIGRPAGSDENDDSTIKFRLDWCGKDECFEAAMSYARETLC